MSDITEWTYNIRVYYNRAVFTLCKETYVLNVYTFQQYFYSIYSDPTFVEDPLKLDEICALKN